MSERSVSLNPGVSIRYIRRPFHWKSKTSIESVPVDFMLFQVRRLEIKKLPRYLQEYSPWPMLASFPLHRETKVLLPDPVIPITRKNLSDGSGLVSPVKAENRWAWSTIWSIAIFVPMVPAVACIKVKRFFLCRNFDYHKTAFAYNSFPLPGGRFTEADEYA